MVNERRDWLTGSVKFIDASISDFGIWSNIALYTGNVRRTKSCELISTRCSVGPVAGWHFHDDESGSSQTEDLLFWVGI